MKPRASPACAASSPQSSMSMALTLSSPIFSSLSIVRSISAGAFMPCILKKPPSTLRLFILMVKSSSPSSVKARQMIDGISASFMMSSFPSPMTSMSA